MKLKLLLVDDEPLARERLRALLAREPDLEILGECGDGHAAVAAVRDLRPDLMFLDVQMPELDGLGVLAKLESEAVPIPAVVFTTAHEKFAVTAFEIDAVDYLLKPFDGARLKAALQRVRARLADTRGRGAVGPRADESEEPAGTARLPDRIPVKSDGRIVLVRVAELDWIEADDNYVRLHAGQEKHLLRETLASMEARLPAGQFVRVSRSAIINVERIKELQPLFHGDYVAILRSGAKVNISRIYRERLRALLGEF